MSSSSHLRSWKVAALPKSRLNTCEKLQQVAKTLGWQRDDRRNSLIPVIDPTRAPDEAHGEYLIFSAYVLSGLNFPMSRFLKTVLDFYEIKLAELSSNSILMLSSFTFFCEMFMGVRANLHLWRNFFSLRSSGQGNTLGVL
jgi:hypothetical protein